MRTMLLRFGIVSGITNRDETIYIYGQYAKIFGDRIGFVSKFKQDRLKESEASEGTRYTFPLRKTELNLSAAKRGEIQRHLAPKEAFVDRAPFHHSKIKSVSRYIGESVCVEVPDGHQFLQNGFCGWNSQGSQFKHAVVMVDWKQDYSNENTRRLAYTAATRASEKLTVLT